MTDDENNIVPLPTPKRVQTIEERNNQMRCAQILARACGMNDFNYERERTALARELKVRPNWLDRRRTEAESRFDLSVNYSRTEKPVQPGQQITIDGEVAFVVAVYIEEKYYVGEKEWIERTRVVYPDEGLSIGWGWRSWRQPIERG